MPLSPSASFRTAGAWAIAVAAILLFAIGLASAPTAAADDTCANAVLRAQNNSTGLPDCRAYEMVSAPYKGGFPVFPDVGFTDDGVVSYQSRGAIAGNTAGHVSNTYHGVRSAAGWTTSSLDPSAVIYNTTVGPSLPGNPVQVESPDLRWTLWRMFPREQTVAAVGFWLRGPDGAFTRVGDALAPGGSVVSDSLNIRGVSADLSHVVLSIGFAGNAADTALVEYVGTGNGWPPRAVSVNNIGLPTPGETCLPEVSSDGRVIIFSSGCSGSGILALHARVAGSATVAVSGSECSRSADDPGGLCNAVSAANYVGAADDGSRVFFTTDQQLVDGDIDQTTDLYACDIPAGAPAPVGAANPCSTLTQVSGTASGAQVASVPVVSGDGSRAYFVAGGAALADNLGVNGVAAVGGRTNLYLWTKDAAHPAGEIRFVARLDANDLSRPQLTPDARYLVFTTASALVTGGPGADTTDAAGDVYRYDAKAHAIVRVSTAVTGGGGNGAGFDASIVAASAMTPDGSMVVFDSAEALSPSDTNGVTDVYGWRDGQVSLISSGGGRSVGVTASGRDIFFTTDAPVLAADRDVNRDIYTARVGGGFDLPPQPPPCAGDGCRGLSSNAPTLAGPRSGPLEDSDPRDAAAVLSLRAVSASQRRRLAATGKLALTVAADEAGRVTATAKAKIGGRSVTVGSARRTMTKPGSVVLTLKLSRKARAQLAARGRLTVRVSVSHSKAPRARSVTLKLTRARAKQSSVGGRS
jgi:hypothetical protein